MNKITPVVKALLIANVLVFFATANWDSRLILALFPPQTELFRPFQLLTHFFMHSGVPHIFFNMFGLYMFGPVLERIWGSRKFLFYYFVCAAGAAVLQFIVWSTGSAELHPVLGASGAIYGLFVGFGVMFPNQKIVLLIPPIPMKAKYFILILIGIDLTLGFSGANSGIAHFAHLGGALAGAILVFYWKKSLPRIQPYQ